VDAYWTDGSAPSPIGDIPRLRTSLDWRDRLGAIRMRWGMGRTAYRVEPRLYAVGSPDKKSPVLVTANYKLSLDHLRSKLEGRDAWVLVLDTKGINVWCAAGKGTFGTDELVARLASERVGEVVSHRKVILPQLGAPGVAAHGVRKQSGFWVVYGPVRAEDLPAFLDAGMEATEAMRRMTFPLAARAAVVPVELVLWSRYVLLAAALMAALSGLGPGGFAWSRVRTDGPLITLLLAASWLAGNALTPLLLPWLPGRSFSAKGAWCGAALVGIVFGLAWPLPGVFGNGTTLAAWTLLLLAATSFLGMNFTGASTYTSLVGVRKEMRVAVPLQLAAGAVGLLLWIVGRFV